MNITYYTKHDVFLDYHFKILFDCFHVINDNMLPKKTTFKFLSSIP